MTEKSTSSFWKEIKERKLFRAAVSYAVISFVIIQIADATFEGLDIPPSAIPWLLSLMAFLFPFVVTAAWLYEVTPKGIVLDERFGNVNRKLEIGFIILTFFVFLTASAALGIFASSNQPDVRSFDREKPTIAVLPFVSFSKVDVSYLGFGIADQLLSMLDNLTEFNIVGRTSSFLLAEQNLGLQEMGRLLGADHIVEGSIVLEGDRVLITAQLIESETLLHVWSESYERDLANLIDLEQEIARNIARAMDVTLSSASDGRLHSPSNVEASAYLFYLQGRDYLRRPLTAWSPPGTSYAPA